MSNDASLLPVGEATLATSRTSSGHAIDELDCAVEAERKARVAIIAIGEEWKKLLDDCTEPTDEEHCLHAHLVREWQRAVGLVDQILQRPLR